MKRILLVVAAVLTWAASPGRAEPISPAVWTYLAVSSNPVIPLGGMPGATAVLQGHDGVHFGNGSIVATTIFTFNNSSPASAAPSTPTTFTETLFFRDVASGEVGSASFNFSLNGTMTPQGSFLSVLPQGPTSERLHLGHYFYDVSADPMQASNRDHGDVAGWITFDVRVQHNPEPSTLILAGLGLPALGLLRRARRARIA
jgi:hypothetical protein